MNKFHAALLTPVLVCLLLITPTLLTACDQPKPAQSPVAALAPPTVLVDPVLLDAHRAAQGLIEPAVNPELYVDEAPKATAVKAPKAKPLFDREAASYRKAARNAERAACLSRVVDLKGDYDIRHGAISDFGNVRLDPICGRAGQGIAIF